MPSWAAKHNEQTLEEPLAPCPLGQAQGAAHQYRHLVGKALDKDRSSWNEVSLRCFGPVLQSACSCGAGDIARSNGYKGIEYLLYEHIKPELDEDMDSGQP